jgi:hypothetical protein
VTDQSGDLIQTARLSLVPLSPGDADEMVEVLGDRRLYEFIGGQPPTLVELRATCARLAAGHPAHHASAAVAARAGLTPTGTYHDGEQLWQRPEQRPR